MLRESGLARAAVMTLERRDIDAPPGSWPTRDSLLATSAGRVLYVERRQMLALFVLSSRMISITLLQCGVRSVVRKTIRPQSDGTRDCRGDCGTGDLAHRGRPESIAAIVRIAGKLECLFYTVPGNHDNDLEATTRIYRGCLSRSFELPLGGERMAVRRDR